MSLKDELDKWNQRQTKARLEYYAHPIATPNTVRGIRVTRTCACGRRTEAQTGMCRTCRTTKGEA